MQALTKFYADQHWNIALSPIGLFQAEQPDDHHWRSRVRDMDYLVVFYAAETISLSVRCMNALYCLQAIQGNAIARLVDLAEAHHEMVNTRDEYIQDLNAQIDERGAQIDQLEGQVQERDTLMGERNAEIELLEEQLNNLLIQLDDAMDHIEMLNAHHAPPDVMDVDAEEEPEEMEGVSALDTISGIPIQAAHGAHSPVRSQSLINDLDDF